MLPERVSMVLTVAATQRLPSSARALASKVAWEACSAWLATSRMAPTIWLMALASCSIWVNSSLIASFASSMQSVTWEAMSLSSLQAARWVPNTSLRLSWEWATALAISPNSSRDLSSTLWLRSLRAKRSSRPTR